MVSRRERVPRPDAGPSSATQCIPPTSSLSTTHKELALLLGDIYSSITLCISARRLLSFIHGYLSCHHFFDDILAAGWCHRQIGSRKGGRGYVRLGVGGRVSGCMYNVAHKPLCKYFHCSKANLSSSKACWVFSCWNGRSRLKFLGYTPRDTNSYTHTTHTVAVIHTTHTYIVSWMHHNICSLRITSPVRFSWYITLYWV